MHWQPGLNARTSVGGSSVYRPMVSDGALALGTTLWRGHEFTTLGREPRALFSPQLPGKYRVRERAASWTGKRVDYLWPDGGVELELRTSLPGPLFRLRDRSLHLRWAFGNEPNVIESLTDAARWGADGVPDPGERRFFLLNSPAMPTLLVLSRPAKEIRIVAHRHWEIRFEHAGESVFLVPLLDREDAPRTEAARELWDQLLATPPVDCEETFAWEEPDRLLRVRQQWEDCKVAPVPPLVSLLAETGGLLTLPSAATPLLKTLFGPYALVQGETFEMRLDTRWQHAALSAPARMVEGDLSPVPDELTYAGDYTWTPQEPMDQLLSLRTWASLVELCPEPRRSELLAKLSVPAPKAFRASLLTLREPVTGRRWSRETLLFEHHGDVCYDMDWYNGLTLSGLERATRCADPGIARAAHRLAERCRDERRHLANYFEIFQDWALGAAWTDPRGLLWNADCSHNGLEGILGEARLRDAEGDPEGAARMRYLGAKTAVALLAALSWPEWCARTCPLVLAASYANNTTFMRNADDARFIGTNAIFTPQTLDPATPAVRNPYLLAGHFPEYAALLRAHGPMDKLRELARIWETEFPQRYADWLTFYVGTDWRERWEKRDQEARVQASVFYHLAPEVCFRRWVLGEDADEIERRFATPLNLAEQLVLRSGVTVE